MRRVSSSYQLSGAMAALVRLRIALVPRGDRLRRQRLLAPGTPRHPPWVLPSHLSELPEQPDVTWELLAFHPTQMLFPFGTVVMASFHKEQGARARFPT